MSSCNFRILVRSRYASSLNHQQMFDVLSGVKQRLKRQVDVWMTAKGAIDILVSQAQAITMWSC
jgi:hypothetical protein